jgi:3-deoxy-manno-octulosonate cytidylyltransferase (CMP-KDO synthetase)
MIVHVWRRAIEADVGPVLVAADSPAIVEAITARGGQAVLTGLHHQSGSDRIFEAISRFDPDQRHDVVINVQGDLPTIEPAPVRAALKPLDNPLVDIATLACVITREDERTNPNVVKVVGTQIAPDLLRALYFTRASAPYGPLCVSACQPLALRQPATLPA